MQNGLTFVGMLAVLCDAFVKKLRVARVCVEQVLGESVLEKVTVSLNSSVESGILTGVTFLIVERKTYKLLL